MGTFFSLLLISACTAFTACNDDAEDSPVLASNKLNITVGLQQPQGRAIITGTTLPESSSIGVLLDDGEATSYDAYNTSSSQLLPKIPNKYGIPHQTSYLMRPRVHSTLTTRMQQVRILLLSLSKQLHRLTTSTQNR